MEEGRPVSTTNLSDGPGPDAVYKDYLGQGKFCIQRCDDCGRHVFYPRLICPGCGSAQLGWVETSGEATVYSTSVVRQRPDRGGDYNIVIVELAEGPKMLSRVEGLPPTEVAIGMAVRARIVSEAESTFVVFDKF